MNLTAVSALAIYKDKVSGFSQKYLVPGIVKSKKLMEICDIK